MLENSGREYLHKGYNEKAVQRDTLNEPFSG